MKQVKKRCDECGRLFLASASRMAGLCPECSHWLYGYPRCDHQFENGRCVKCLREVDAKSSGFDEDK